MIHLLTGENTFEIERRLAEIVAGFDGDVERVDGSELTPEQLPDLLAGVTLFSSKRLVVIKNASANKTVWTTLSDWLEKDIDNDLVFVEPKPDKRTKTYKLLEKHADVFVAKDLQFSDAVSWVGGEAKKRALELSSDTIRFFVDYVGVDQWRLSTELDKLALAGKPINKELIRELVEPTPQATSFELLDAAFAGRHNEVKQLLNTVARQEDPYMFFGLLAGQVYALALAKTAGTTPLDTVAKTAGIHPFVLKKVGNLAQNLDLPDVKRIVAKLAELDVNLKSRPVEPWIQIQAFLLSLI